LLAIGTPTVLNINNAIVQSQFDMHADPNTGVISGSIYGADQIFCGNVNSTEWLVTQFKASNQASGIPQYYCLNTGDTFNPATSQPCQLPPLPPGFTPNRCQPDSEPTSDTAKRTELRFCGYREYAGRRGWVIVEEFTDQGVSGSKESRPALNRLMADACRRRFDAVLVWKIVRFGRSLKHLVNALAELAALGVAFISLRDNLDLSTPSGRLMFQK